MPRNSRTPAEVTVPRTRPLKVKAKGLAACASESAGMLHSRSATARIKSTASLNLRRLGKAIGTSSPGRDESASLGGQKLKSCVFKTFVGNCQEKRKRRDSPGSGTIVRNFLLRGLKLSFVPGCTA